MPDDDPSDPSYLTADQTMPTPGPGGPPGQARGTAAASPAAAPPPRVVGYDVAEMIGAGGMGTVWRARQHGTGRDVALKFLTDRPSDPTARARFVREVELASRLAHPNVARVYDSGVHEGRYYYAMELVDGVPLDRYVQAHRLDCPAILRLVRALCEAVQHAHFKGIIHRDLKPSNILVTADGQPRVLDFGLARPITPGPGAMITDDRAGRAGTPAYMSPEQAAGRADLVDTRSDVYSLGKILYELLVGRPAHDLSGSEYDLWRRVVELDVRRPRALNPCLSADLEAVLLKALDREPHNRYGSAGELAKDLENVIRNEPVSARPATVRYFLGKKLARHRAAVAAGLAFALVLSGLAVYSYVRIAHERDVARAAGARADRERDAADVARAKADAEGRAAARQAANAVAVNRFVQRVLDALDPRNARGTTNVSREMMERANRTLSESFAGDPQTESSIRVALGRNLLALGQFPAAEVQLTRAVDLLTPARLPGGASSTAPVFGPLPPDALAAMDLLAQVERELGNVKEAAALAERVYEQSRGRFGAADERTLGAMNTHAYVLGDLGRGDQAEIKCRDALLLAGVRSPDDLKPGDAKPVALTLASTLGRVLRETRDPAKLDEAEQWARQVYASRGDAARLTSPAGDSSRDLDALEAKHDLASALNAKAIFFHNSAAWDEALELHRAVVATGEAVLGPDHPDLLIWQNDLAVALAGHADTAGDGSGASNLAESERIYRAILPAAAAVRRSEDQYTVRILGGLLEVLRREGKRAEADAYARQLEAYAARAAGRLSREFGPDNAQVLVFLDALVTALNYQQKRDEAEAANTRALDARRAIFGAAHRETLTTAMNLALVRWAAGRLEAARKLLAETLGLCEQSLPSDDPLSGRVRQALERLEGEMKAADGASRRAGTTAD